MDTSEFRTEAGFLQQQQQSVNSRNVRITWSSHRCTKSRQPRAVSKIRQDDVADEFNMIRVESRRTRDVATPHIF